MKNDRKVPNAPGQLVWCPSDPALGIGLVTEREGARVRVRFGRLNEERHYTTRTAELAILRYEIGHGERVQDQEGRELRVRRRLAAGSEPLAIYELEDGRNVAESELVPHVRAIGAKQRLASLSLVHPEVVRARLEGLRLSHFGGRPGFAAVVGSRVQWLPHQIDVASRAIDGDPVRLLLADEVGLGKTVEAALIYAGLRHEGRAERVLILTPEALCIQWLGEIYRKSHELLVWLDGTRLADARSDFPDLSPFEAHQRLVMSLECLAQDEVLGAQAGAAFWDLIIVDEAHHLRWNPTTGGNPAYRLVETLAQRTRHLLLLTATPMALDPTEYHALLRLLDPARFDDPATFGAVADRAVAIRNVGGALAAAMRDAAPLAPAAGEQATALLADDPEDAASLAHWQQLPVDSPERDAVAEDLFVALRQRHGLADYVVRNRRGPVGGLPARLPKVFPLRAEEAQEALLEVGETIMLELADAHAESGQRGRVLGELMRALWATPRALLDIVRAYSAPLAAELAPYVAAVVDAPLDAAGLPTGDARLRWLVGQLRALGPGEKMLVFVESAVAVRALRDALDPLLDGRLAMFHRDLSPRDQDRQVAYFRDPAGPSVMLSTEAGGEGRNFQFCHRVVLYDLPWRPATVEQRIGRVDRVGQRHDVEVLVPFFEGGFEAAILKVMQDAIGVLARTVGGIDHALEYVSDRIADLMLEQAGTDGWKGLYRDTETLVREARRRIDDDVDPILDHASFEPSRAAALLATIPDDLERRIEDFVQRYAEHSRLELHGRGAHRIAVEGAPGASGRDDSGSGFMATFARTDALDHEDLEFLSFGHPLVEQALDWARSADDAAAALAICRGFPRDGAAFVWSFGLELPEDVPEAVTYFDAPLMVFALDERGARLEALDDLLQQDGRALDRMDPAPLRASQERWRALVDANHEAAETVAQARIRDSAADAEMRLSRTMSARQRDLRRAQVRELANLPAAAPTGERLRLEAQQEAAGRALEQEHQRLARALQAARPRLVAAVAVRLMRSRHVSG